ncbi:MAG: hypothetical protein HY057_10345 [Rhodospirillales bacterium]|nr:hypothetical protein [Rhodospirillales bacterium]
MAAISRRKIDGPADVLWAGALAADCLARAVARGVWAARRLGNMPAYRDLYGPPLRRPRTRR